MKILVTGGAGFIGSWLCEALVKKHEVICLDNLSCSQASNIEHLKNNTDINNFIFLQKDVSSDVSNIPKVDYIMHFAARPSPVDYMNNPVDTIRANSKGTENMLDLANKFDCPVMFASTSEVYGDPLVHPQPESYWGNVNPIGVRSCYDESKRFSEALMFAYHRQFGTKIKIIRIFNTYGPRMRKDDGRVVPNFILQALKNKSLTVFGDGTQTRSFCYIKDLVDGILAFMESPETGPVNLGNPNEITVNELAAIIVELTDSKSFVEFKELPKDDPVKRKPDISLARKILEWEPKVLIRDGLKDTINFFKNI